MPIAISEDPKQFGVTFPEVHVTKTCADAVFTTAENSVAVRASKSGRYTTVPSNSKTVKSTIRNVPRRST
jgi:hypothetical protein